MNDSTNEDIPIKKRQQIFKEELEMLKETKLIPKTDYIRMNNAYERYVRYVQQIEKDRLSQESESNGQESIQTDSVSTVTEAKIERKVSSKVQPSFWKQEETASKKVVTKVEKTSEQLRERNISIVLITGVILLLFGGLIWATSTWGNLHAVFKVICISLVSVFFAGNAFIASKLKIKQTAFAFLTLASLFIPISILSASYYHIFGEYLSLQGEGRGLLGFIGGLLCLGIYFKIANYFQSKLFIFISLVTFTLTAFFAMSYLTFSNEALFLLMAVFNLLFLLNLEKIKNIQKLLLFKPYGLQFITFKIIVEAFVMLTLFLSTITYSVTVIITAVLFFILAFRYKKAYCHFVFSILFTYGYIHLVFNSMLDEIAVVAFAFIPLIFTGLFKYLKKVDQALSKSFMYTSLVASSLVFLYVYALFFSEQETQRFFALLILSAQFVYLSFEEKRKAFTYPALVLFTLAFFHLGLAFQLSISATLNLIFVVQIVLYLSLYVYNHYEKWNLYRESALYISGFVMLGITFLKYAGLQWLELSLCLAIISGLFLITYYKDRSQKLREWSTFGFPISLTLALIALYPYFTESSRFYEQQVEVSVHLLVVSLLVIGLGFVWKKRAIHFFHVFFIAGQSVSFVSFIFLYNSSLPAMVVTVVMLITTGINGLSVYLYHKHWLWLGVLVTSVGVYGSLFAVFDFHSDFFHTAFYLIGPLLFLLIGGWIGKYSVNGRRYFFWYSQLMNVVAIPVGYLLLAFEELSPWLYVFVLLMYVISALRSQIHWQKSIFTYVGFVALYLQVLLFCTNVPYTASLTFMLTAVIILVLWGVSNQEWKKIIEYYLIPFLHLVVGVHLIEVFVDGFPSSMEIAWVGGETLLLGCAGYFLIRRKWEQMLAIPLLFTLLYFTMYSDTLQLLPGSLVLFGWMIVMLLLSKRYFQGIVRKTETGSILDYYRIVGFFFLLVMNGRIQANQGEEWVLEILVSILVVVYFWLIRTWTIERIERKVYLAAAVTLSLYPYQVIVNQLDHSRYFSCRGSYSAFVFHRSFFIKENVKRRKTSTNNRNYFCFLSIWSFDH